jgi:hypothetical protein
MGRTMTRVARDFNSGLLSRLGIAAFGAVVLVAGFLPSGIFQLQHTHQLDSRKEANARAMLFD